MILAGPHPQPSDKFETDINRDKNPLFLALIHSNRRVISHIECKLAHGMQLSGQEIYVLHRSLRTIERLQQTYDAETARWWSLELMSDRERFE